MDDLASYDDMLDDVMDEVNDSALDLFNEDIFNLLINHLALQKLILLSRLQILVKLCHPAL